MARVPHRVELLLAATLVLGVAGGCRSSLTGNEGNLVFSYHATENLTDFNKPIAVGAKLDVKVAEVGTRRAATLQTAESDDEGVLQVVSFLGDTFVLLGTGAGNVLVSVSAKVPSGDVVTDSVNMQAKVPQVLNLNHSCTNESTGLYLVDQDVSIHFDLEMTNRQPVIGYGYYPVDIDPEDGLSSLNATSKKQEFMDFHTAAAKQTVTLRSQIVGTTASFRLVEKRDVDGAVLDDAGTHSSVMVGGAGRWLHVVPTVGGTRVCQARMEGVTATSDTPDVCEVNAGHLPDDLPADELEQWGLVIVKGKAVGHCQFTVTHPEARGGQGIESSFEIDVAEVVEPE